MQLFNGDCLEVMKSIPDKSVDMVLCDVPYGTTACKWDNVIPFEPMWEQLDRIIKDNGAICLFGSEPFSSYLRMSNIKNFKYDWIWRKNTSAGFIHAKNMPLKKHEIISVFSNGSMGHKSVLGKKRMVYYPQGLIPKKTVYHGNKKNCVNIIGERPSQKTDFISDFTNYPISVIETKEGSNNNFYHPTQKPVLLLEYLIKTYTLENETVLDFTMGSGSTGVACVNTNRNFIGIELDKKYFEIAKERINEAAMLNSIAYKSTVGRSD